MTEQRYVTGLFPDAETAQQGVDALIEEHFPSRDIGVLVRDESGVSEAPVSHETGIESGIKVGGGAGAALGAIGGALVSIGALPAIGLGLAASGPIAAAASAAVAGAAGGGLLGGLSGLGRWTKSPDLPEQLRNGGVVVSVPAGEERRVEARIAMEAAGASWVEDETDA